MAHSHTTILVAEDEPRICELMVATLKAEGYNVLHASNGPDAIEIARRLAADIHLLVTDFKMPTMNGDELADRLLDTRPYIKVLFASGTLDSDSLPILRGATCVAHLAKPYTPRQLVDEVRIVLDSTERAVIKNRLVRSVR